MPRQIARDQSDDEEINDDDFDGSYYSIPLSPNQLRGGSNNIQIDNNYLPILLSVYTQWKGRNACSAWMETDWFIFGDTFLTPTAHSLAHSLATVQASSTPRTRIVDKGHTTQSRHDRSWHSFGSHRHVESARPTVLHDV